MKKVTTIITNYNYGNYVLNALRSAQNQTYKNHHIVLVDDGSSDNSWDKIQDYLGNKYNHAILEKVDYPYYKGLLKRESYNNLELICINNSGASTARNVGIWQAWDSDYFCILDADDEMMPDKIEKLLYYSEEYPEIGVAYADYSRNIKGMYSKDELKQPYSRDRLYSECIIHSGALIKKKYLEKILLPRDEIYDSKLHGPLSKGFIGCTEDYDLWIRLSKKCMIVHVPEILSIVNESNHNQSLKMNQQIFQKNMEIISSR